MSRSAELLDRVRKIDSEPKATPELKATEPTYCSGVEFVPNCLFDSNDFPNGWTHHHAIAMVK